MTQMMQVIYFSCITDHMWVNRYVPIQQESLCNIYIKKLKTYCKHTQHHNFGKSRPIRHAIWLFWGSHGFPHRFPLHNVLFVQYIYLAIEQAETYRKSCSLIYLVTYICPSAFDCEENAFFRIFVKSNSKSGRFSSFLMPNNFGTGQKKAYFLGALEN